MPADRKLTLRAVQGLLQLQIILGLLLFLPAGTVAYRQGWIYWSLSLICYGLITLDLALHNPDLLARRMTAGSNQEKRSAQKAILGFASLLSMGLILVSSLDRAHRWSYPPTWALVLGEAMFVLGAWVIFRVFRENTYTAATVRVEEGQTVTATGPYRVVRHPMYSGALLILFGTPLVLSSFWGLTCSVGILVLIVLRILDEEKMLVGELAGYGEYRSRVRWRLVPWVW